MPSITTTRRNFLKQAILLSAVGLVNACGIKGHDREAHAASLTSVVADRKAAQRFAKKYLCQYPDEKNEAILSNRIIGALVKNTKLSNLSDVDQVFSGLIQTVLSEFTRGDIIQINGWFLSRTEARLYTLAYFFPDRSVA